MPARTDGPDRIIDSLISILEGIRTGHTFTRMHSDETTMVWTADAFGDDPNTVYVHAPEVEGVDENFVAVVTRGTGGARFAQSAWHVTCSKNTITLKRNFVGFFGPVSFDYYWIAIRR